MTTATTTTGAPQVAINDIGSAEDFMAAIDASLRRRVQEELARAAHQYR